MKQRMCRAAYARAGRLSPGEMHVARAFVSALVNRERAYARSAAARRPALVFKGKKTRLVGFGPGELQHVRLHVCGPGRHLRYQALMVAGEQSA